DPGPPKRGGSVPVVVGAAVTPVAVAVARMGMPRTRTPAVVILRPARLHDRRSGCGVRHSRTDPERAEAECSRYSDCRCDIDHFFLHLFPKIVPGHRFSFFCVRLRRYADVDVGMLCGSYAPTRTAARRTVISASSDTTTPTAKYSAGSHGATPNSASESSA